MNADEGLLKPPDSIVFGPARPVVSLLDQVRFREQETEED